MIVDAFIKLKESLLAVLKPKQKFLVGIEVKADYMRLVELSCVGTEFCVEGCIFLETGGGLGSGAVLSPLKNFLRQHKLHTKNVVSALPYSKTTIKEVEIDAGLSEKELDKFFRFQIEADNAFHSKEFDFDYQLIRPGHGIGQANSVYLVIALREDVNELLGLLGDLNFKPVVLDVDIYALQRSVYWQLQRSDQVVLAINIDRNNMLILISEAKNVVYMHSESIAVESGSFIEQVTSNIYERLNKFCLDKPYHIDVVVLAGEMATLGGFVDELNTRFSCNVIIADPFCRMKISSKLDPDEMKQMAPMMAISAGLAFRVSDE